MRFERDQAAFRRREPEPGDGIGEGTVPELAVDVGCDGTADGHVARAGHDERKPSERKEHPHQHLDAHARFDRAGPLRGVEIEDPVELCAPHDVAAAVLGRVAVAPAQPARHDATRVVTALARAFLDEPKDVARAGGLPNLRARRRGTAPAGQHLAVRTALSGVVVSHRAPRLRSR